jgi:hypothetical protein
MSIISIQTSAIAFLTLFKILELTTNICAITSSFLADIQIGFLTHSSKSTTKYSGIIFRISLFGKSIQFFAISSTLSTSSEVIVSQDIATTHLFTITSKLEEEKDK